MDSTLNGDCADNVLPGDRIVRSREDTDALEKEGKCNYTIAGNLENYAPGPHSF